MQGKSMEQHDGRTVPQNVVIDLGIVGSDFHVSSLPPLHAEAERPKAGAKLFVCRYVWGFTVG
jgi:hypothetical protein